MSQEEDIYELREELQYLRWCVNQLMDDRGNGYGLQDTRAQLLKEVVSLRQEVASLTKQLDTTRPQIPIYPTYPIAPTYPDVLGTPSTCTKCGMHFDLMTGYVCPVYGCPTFTQTYCSTGVTNEG